MPKVLLFFICSFVCNCLLGRQLKDTCNNSMQCSAVTPNATCRSGVCECTEGLIDISSTCVNGKYHTCLISK